MLRHWIQEDKLKIEGLCRNHHPSALRIIEQNPEKIDWASLSCCPNAIELLENNKDNIALDSEIVSRRPSFFLNILHFRD